MTRRALPTRTPLGRRLRFARIDVANVTQAQLAARSGVTRDSISRIESGETVRPFRDTVERIAAALGVRADWLRGDGDVIRPGLYFVYMMTDRHQHVLFVGVCTNLPAQIERHKRTSSWARGAARVQHVAVTGYADALALRDDWVARYLPVWNVRAMAEGHERTDSVRRAV